MANVEITELPSKGTINGNDLLMVKDQGDNGDYRLLMSLIKTYCTTLLNTPVNASDPTTKTYVDTADAAIIATITALPTPMVFKGGIDLSTGDSALPSTPANGWTYIVTVGGEITATKDGSAASTILTQPNDTIVYDDIDDVWWVFDAAGDALQPTKDVATPYTLLDQDTGKFLVFNDASDCTITVPDGLTRGVSIAAANTGGGNIIISPNTDTVRGASTLADVDGYLALTKITSTVWQSSERT